jgi:predicted nucleic acid-binding protein
VIVLDASAVVEWLLQTVKADAVEARAFSKTTTSQRWHAPHLLDVEVAQALRRLVAAGHVSATRANEALEDLTDLPLVRYPHDWLLRCIWELRHNLTAYDAAYVALAEALDSPLVTCDGRIRAAPGHHARVELI